MITFMLEKWLKAVAEKYALLRFNGVILLTVIALIMAVYSTRSPAANWPTLVFIASAIVVLALESAFVLAGGQNGEPGTMSILGMIVALGFMLGIQRALAGLSLRVGQFIDVQKAGLPAEETKSSLAGMKDLLAEHGAKIEELQSLASAMKDHFDALLVGIAVGLIMAFFIALVVRAKKAVG